MDSDPCVFGEMEQHLFAMRHGFHQHGTGQRFFQIAALVAAEDSFFAMQFHREDFLFETAVPLLSIKFNFR